MTLTRECADKLKEFFPAHEIEWLPKTLTKDGQKAMGLAYINARAVMDRLDDVIGVGNWEDAYRVVRMNNEDRIECSLTIHGVTKTDIGEPNAAGTADKHKGAYSDALKRAAVKFGIGRYLYKMPAVWARCETSEWQGKKRFKKWIDQPQILPQFLPESERGKQKPASKRTTPPTTTQSNKPSTTESTTAIPAAWLEKYSETLKKAQSRGIAGKPANSFTTKGDLTTEATRLNEAIAAFDKSAKKPSELDKAFPRDKNGAPIMAGVQQGMPA